MLSAIPIRFFTTSVKAKPNRILLQCRVKPGVGAERHGILSVTDSHILIGISARPRNGEANLMLIKILSNSLKFPKSNIEIVRGHKCQSKTVLISCVNIIDSEKTQVDYFLKKLEAASRSVSY